MRLNHDNQCEATEPEENPFQKHEIFLDKFITETLEIDRTDPLASKIKALFFAFLRKNPDFTYSENFVYLLSVLLNFLTEDSAFILLEKLLWELSYEEIMTKDFFEKERFFLLKSLNSHAPEENSENAIKIIDLSVFRMYSGLFFDPEMDFQLSMKIFEKIIEKPSVATLEACFLALLRLNIESLLGLPPNNPSRLLDLIGKATSLSAFDQEFLRCELDLEYCARDPFNLSQDSNEKILTIEELNLSDQPDKKSSLKTFLLGFFSEALNRVHDNSDLTNFLIHEKNEIFEEFFDEKAQERRRSRGNKHQGHLSCGGIENVEFYSKFQVDLLRNRIEILEKANESLIQERMMHRRYEKELDNKLSELSVKTSMFFKQLDGKPPSKKVETFRTNRDILGVVEGSLKEIIEDRIGLFAREMEYLKIVLVDKRKDLVRIMENENMLKNEEIVVMEIDKSLKVMREFITNYMRKMWEREDGGKGTQKVEREARDDCKVCMIF